MNDKNSNYILKEVIRYFGFLYDVGYSIQRIEYHPEAFGNWEVVLKSEECILEICNDRNEIMAYFIPINGDRRYQIGIKSMVYYLTKEKKFIKPFSGNLFWNKKKQFEELAALLKEYINQAAPYFGCDFNEHREELLMAQRKYFDAVVNQLRK